LVYPPPELFSQNKPDTSIFLLEQTSISHQPNEQAVSTEESFESLSREKKGQQK
jgi:hypothetical protein